MCLTPSEEVPKSWRQVTRDLFMGAGRLLHTAQLLIQGALVCWCAKTLTRAQTSVRWWFVKSAPLKLYAAHRIQQRSLTGLMARVAHEVIVPHSTCRHYAL